MTPKAVQQRAHYWEHKEAHDTASRRYYHEHPEADRARVKKKQDRRRALLARFKLFKGCIDCGYREHAAALEFDHVRGSKLFKVGALGISCGKDKLKSELAKCEVRCANCHNIAGFNRRNPGAFAGSRTIEGNVDELLVLNLANTNGIDWNVDLEEV